MNRLFALALAGSIATAAIAAPAAPALAWSYQECLGPNGQINVNISPDCAQYATPAPVWTPAPTPVPTAPPPRNVNHNQNTNTNTNTQNQHQTQNQSQNTSVRNSIGIRNNVSAQGGSATGGAASASATGGAGGSAVIAPGAAQGGSASVAPGAVTNTNTVYGGGYVAPLPVVNGILGDCSSHATVSGGISVQRLSGGFPVNQSQVGGYVGATVPLGGGCPKAPRAGVDHSSDWDHCIAWQDQGRDVSGLPMCVGMPPRIAAAPLPTPVPTVAPTAAPPQIIEHTMWILPRPTIALAARCDARALKADLDRVHANRVAIKASLGTHHPLPAFLRLSDKITRECGTGSQILAALDV